MAQETELASWPGTLLFRILAHTCIIHGLGSFWSNFRFPILSPSSKSAISAKFWVICPVNKCWVHPFNIRAQRQIGIEIEKTLWEKKTKTLFWVAFYSNFTQSSSHFLPFCSNLIVIKWLKVMKNSCSHLRGEIGIRIRQKKSGWCGNSDELFRRRRMVSNACVMVGREEIKRLFPEKLERVTGMRVSEI